MGPIAYLVRAELKKHLGDSPEETRTCLVLPPPECSLTQSESAAKVFDLVVDAVRQGSRYAVVEEVFQRRVFVEDLRPFRNSLLLERDAWKCFAVRV
jgi:hypothetical protein